VFPRVPWSPTTLKRSAKSSGTSAMFDGENIAIEYRWAEGQDDRLPNLATELVRLKPDIIVTTGTPSALAAMQATNTIPIVMASSADPVAAGLVASLARPGANVTGFTILGAELEGKRLEILKQAVPDLSRVAVLWNQPSYPISKKQRTRAGLWAFRLTRSRRFAEQMSWTTLSWRSPVLAPMRSQYWRIAFCSLTEDGSSNSRRRGDYRGCTRTGNMWTTGGFCRTHRATSNCFGAPGSGRVSFLERYGAGRSMA
jgi:hypothetical protein